MKDSGFGAEVFTSKTWEENWEEIIEGSVI